MSSDGSAAAAACAATVDFARAASPAERFGRDVVAVLGLPFDVLGLDAAVERIRSAAATNTRCFLSTPNLNWAMAARADTALRDSVLGSDLSLPDGMPIVWTARRMGLPLRERVAGASVFDALAAHAGEPLGVYFFGGPPGAAAAAGRALDARGGGLRCVGFDEAGHGAIDSMSTPERIARINGSGAQLVVVALGAAKGQAWIVRNAAALAAPVLCHLGAVVNFAAGTVRRAPAWMQRSGLEWLWRIGSEPALWRRYARDGAAFLRVAAAQATAARRPATAPPDRATPIEWSARMASADTCVVEPRGEWRAADLAPMRAVLVQASERGHAVEVRLGAVSGIDAAFVGLFLLARGSFGAERFRLVEASDGVSRDLRRCGAEFLLQARSRGELRILIVAESASARFGGEAALPLHYFRVLRRRGWPVWLVTHARTRGELAPLFVGEERIVYVEDTAWHRTLWRVGRHLPPRLSHYSAGLLSRLSTQLAQRRIVHRLVREQGVTVIHQPMPVSPREPSMLFGFGVPVVIGPMNGGMDYPPAFRRERGALEKWSVDLGRASAAFMNRLMPGKRLAATLLVANQRTREALPAGLCTNVVEVVENGVDRSVWDTRPPATHTGTPSQGATATFVYMGRLVTWKAVDLLLHAFARAAALAPMRLLVIGDGEERAALEAIAERLGLSRSAAQGGQGQGGSGQVEPAQVEFCGWLDQATCARRIGEADALVLPSLLECGGAVVLEAMAMAKPVIATAWGGPLDYLDASCGVLVPPISREAIVAGFAAAMAALASDAERREALGRRGAAKVAESFDWELKVDRMLEVYEDAVRLQR